ncbi:MAG: 2-hydroxyacyl-CoA dehydratase family protein [bacterium]|nr:2-hydroxyacyl-CoA dehydratase family protein [bacterium]
MPISALTEILKAGADDPTFPEVTVWKKSHPGGKAIGCLPIYTPAEMIHAAGMLPVHLSGAMGRLKLDNADAYLQDFVCSVAQSTLELYLDGFLENIDAVIFPSICEVLRGVSGIWKRIDPDKPIIYLNLPQNYNSGSASNYMISELGRLKTELEKISGSAITDDALFKSFELFNKRAELLNKLDLYRSDYPGKFKASEFYILRLAGRAIPVEEHIELLQEALSAVEETQPRKRPIARIVLFGAFCERPPIAMIEAMEEERIALVYDDLFPGMHWSKDPLPLAGDPLKILADHYLKSNLHTPVVNHPESSIGDAIMNIVRARNADGLLLATAKSCHPMLHDLHDIFATSEKQGIPYVKIEFEEDQQVFESIIVQIEAIIEARERMPFAGTDRKEGSGDQK